jgi:hypothetical protein
VGVYAFLGEDERAVEEAAPILAGELCCMEVPHGTFGRLLLPLVRLGRLAEAMEYHHRGYRLVADNRDFLFTVSHHLTFLVLTEHAPQGLKLLEKHLVWALETAEQDARFAFVQAAFFLFDRLLETGRRTVPLRLPATFTAYQESAAYDVADLAAWFDEDRRGLAARFDERNGNRNYARRIADHRKLRALIQPFPLHPSRKKREREEAS